MVSFLRDSLYSHTSFLYSTVLGKAQETALHTANQVASVLGVFDTPFSSFSTSSLSPHSPSSASSPTSTSSSSKKCKPVSPTRHPELQINPSIMLSSSLVAETIQLSMGMTQYYFIDNPDGGPLIVLVHGFTESALTLRDLACQLALAGHRVLWFDRYGDGFSDSPEVPYTTDLFTLQMEELMDSAGFSSDEEIVLCGNSLGGIIAALAAVQTSRKVVGLILINPCGAVPQVMTPLSFLTNPSVGMLKLFTLVGSVPMVGENIARALIWGVFKVVHPLFVTVERIETTAANLNVELPLLAENVTLRTMDATMQVCRTFPKAGVDQMAVLAVFFPNNVRLNSSPLVSFHWKDCLLHFATRYATLLARLLPQS